MKTILKHNAFQLSITLIIGLFVGWLLFHEHNPEHTHASEDSTTIWTCSMHPSIKQDHPGICPLCAMDLTPLHTESDDKGSWNEGSIHLSPEALQLANVATSVVSRQAPVKELRLYGKVQLDERFVRTQTAHLSGRIEQLFVNFTGETVKKGQLLALINSPDLIAAQQELLEAAAIKNQQPQLFEAAKTRLRQWKLSDRQIDDIVRTGQVKTNMEIHAESEGIVTAKRVNTGDYVSAGSVLYDVANLSQVWILFDAYESDLPFLQTGASISFTLEALPGTKMQSTIKFIDPMVDPTNRVSKVRVEINNSSGRLKPEMFATGIVKANLDRYKNALVIPSTAILWTGKRSVVYVKQDEGVFALRDVELGPKLSNSYVILEGLEEGEEVVTEGAFSVDAAAQLQDKPSMMNME